MDFNFQSFTTKFCSYKTVDLSDSKTILDIRKSREDSVLKNISYSSVDQDAYLESYYQRFKCKKEIYNAQMLIEKLKKRELYKLVSIEEYNKFIKERDSNNNYIRVKYSLGINNPFDNIYFYNKNSLGKRFKKNNEDYNNNYKEEIKIYKR